MITHPKPVNDSFDLGDEWISIYGSNALQAMAERGYQCTNDYYKERLKLENPGWGFIAKREYKRIDKIVPLKILNFADKISGAFVSSQMRELFHYKYELIAPAPKWMSPEYCLVSYKRSLRELSSYDLSIFWQVLIGAAIGIAIPCLLVP
ncbi:hypothetical protein [Merismopedia glauca]|uniref:Uncharacterized protein n=1 Tax=Merismopedia glauca CCAP 1448/3 TaxID=1296344 RepID=A0A2T1C474_9CYAN|nr:hypothetical protein [Merismopedia glauca]PSB03056.1 hypothetical protein C7B64_10355 [Merismopedia glauca CCAP 1448/3]